MARIAVIGLGSIGGAVAGAVADAIEAGHEHELVGCARTPLNRVVVTRPDGDRELPMRIITEPREWIGPPADWVLLATKTYDTEAAAPWLNVTCGAGTTVAVLQNGITHRERVEPLVGGATVLPVVVILAAERSAPGRIVHNRPGMLLVPDDDPGQRFEELLAPSVVDVRVVEDFTTALWTKLVMNSTMGSVALTRARNTVTSIEPMADAIGALLAEAVAVARAEGAAIDDDLVTSLRSQLTRGADHLSSLAADVIAGRPLEWRERNEIIGRLGREHGIATPRHDLLTSLLAAIDEHRAAGNEL
ncbi:MAG: 2-dehydropantoate 2-reductase [Actinomycetota bacterium]